MPPGGGGGKGIGDLILATYVHSFLGTTAPIVQVPIMISLGP